METASPFQPAINLSAHLYDLLVYTLTVLLPPPLDGTPEALRTMNAERPRSGTVWSSDNAPQECDKFS
jgi:hypothetical protein